MECALIREKQPHTSSINFPTEIFIGEQIFIFNLEKGQVYWIQVDQSHFWYIIQTDCFVEKWSIMDIHVHILSIYYTDWLGHKQTLDSDSLIITSFDVYDVFFFEKFKWAV